MAVTRSGAIPCSSTASPRWISFQTNTRSGCHLSRPLFAMSIRRCTPVVVSSVTPAISFALREYHVGSSFSFARIAA